MHTTHTFARRLPGQLACALLLLAQALPFATADPSDGICQVPTEYATIALAKAACGSGREVVVDGTAGPFAENLTWDEVGITLRSLDPANKAVITGTGTVVNSPHVTLRNVHFDNSAGVAGAAVTITGLGTELYVFDGVEFTGPGYASAVATQAVGGTLLNTAEFISCTFTGWKQALPVFGNNAVKQTRLVVSDGTFSQCDMAVSAQDIYTVVVTNNVCTDCGFDETAVFEVGMNPDATEAQRLTMEGNTVSQSISGGFDPCPPYVSAFYVHDVSPAVTDFSVKTNQAQGFVDVGMRVSNVPYTAVEKIFPAGHVTYANDEKKLVRELGRMDNHPMDVQWHDVLDGAPADDPTPADCTTEGTCPCDTGIAASQVCDDLCPDPAWNQANDSVDDILFGYTTSASFREAVRIGGNAVQVAGDAPLSGGSPAGMSAAGLNAFTVEMWVRVADPGPTGAAEEYDLLTLVNGASDPSLQVYVEDGRVRARILADGAGSGLDWDGPAGGAAISYGSAASDWHHVEVSFDGAVMTISVDTYETDSSPTILSGTGIAASDTLVIGGGDVASHSAEFEEVRLWSVYRTPVQVAEFREIGIPDEATDPGATAGLEGYYTFDADHLTDSSPAANDLLAPATATLVPSPMQQEVVYGILLGTTFDEEKATTVGPFPYGGSVRQVGNCDNRPVLQDVGSGGPTKSQIWNPQENAMFSSANYLFPQSDWNGVVYQNMVYYVRYQTLNQMQNCRKYGEDYATGTSPVTTATLNDGTVVISGRYYVTQSELLDPSGASEAERHTTYATFDFTIKYYEDGGSLVELSTNIFSFDHELAATEFATGCTTTVCNVQLFIRTTVAHLEQQTPGQQTTFLSDAAVSAQTGVAVVDFQTTTATIADCAATTTSTDIVDDFVNSNSDLTRWTPTPSVVEGVAGPNPTYFTFAANGRTTLTIPAVGPHNRITVSGDLIVSGSDWDGFDSSNAPRLVQLSLDGYGGHLLSTTFSNAGGSDQAYPAAYDGGSTTSDVTRSGDWGAGAYVEYLSVTAADFDSIASAADFAALPDTTDRFTSASVSSQDSTTPSFDGGLRAYRVLTGYQAGNVPGSSAGAFDLTATNLRDVLEEQTVRWSIWVNDVSSGPAVFQQRRVGSFTVQNNGAGQSTLVSGTTAFSGVTLTGDVYVVYEVTYAGGSENAATFSFGDPFVHTLVQPQAVSAAQSGSSYASGSDLSVYAFSYSVDHDYDTISFHFDTSNLAGNAVLGVDNVRVTTHRDPTHFCVQTWVLATGINGNPDLQIESDLTGSKTYQFTPYVYDPDIADYRARGTNPLEGTLDVSIARNSTIEDATRSFDATLTTYADAALTNPQANFNDGEEIHSRLSLNLLAGETNLWRIEDINRVRVCSPVGTITTSIAQYDRENPDTTGCNSPTGMQVLYVYDHTLAPTDPLLFRQADFEPSIAVHNGTAHGYEFAALATSEAYIRFNARPIVTTGRTIYLEVTFNVTVQEDASGAVTLRRQRESFLVEKTFGAFFAPHAGAAEEGPWTQAAALGSILPRYPGVTPTMPASNTNGAGITGDRGSWTQFSVNCQVGGVFDVAEGRCVSDAAMVDGGASAAAAAAAAGADGDSTDFETAFYCAIGAVALLFVIVMVMWWRTSKKRKRSKGYKSKSKYKPRDDGV